jgi:hypothetical protein
MKLDQTHVPESLWSMIPLAERWGDPDDGYRESAVQEATTADLEELVGAVVAAPEDFDTWLVGEESYSPTPSDEYLAFSALMMAYELAKTLLARRPPDSDSG